MDEPHPVCRDIQHQGLDDEAWWMYIITIISLIFFLLLLLQTTIMPVPSAHPHSFLFPDICHFPSLLLEAAFSATGVSSHSVSIRSLCFVILEGVKVKSIL
jgi:hypothetical protein